MILAQEANVTKCGARPHMKGLVLSHTCSFVLDLSHITSHTCKHQDLCPSGLARFTGVRHALLQTTFFEFYVYVGAELFLGTSSVLYRSQTGIKMSSFATESYLLHPP